MVGLKKLVRQRLLGLTVLIMAVILLVAVFFQILGIQKQARENANAMFAQVRQIIDKSEEELERIEAEYRETCLLNAESIAYIIGVHPEILGNVEEFRQLAKKLEVDEIHIFDATGRIFTGTHPEYFNFTFDSGEQINFFKPMLEDKTLRLCQDIAPNTAEGKLVQYSALWSTEGKYIIQVGMYPSAVLDMTEKSEISYIFSLLRGNPGVSMYAISPLGGKIVGSSTTVENGKRIVDIGLSLRDVAKYEKGTHVTVNGVDSFCMFENIDGTLIGYVISNDQLYGNIGEYTLLLALCLAVIAAVLVVVVQLYTDRYIIGSIAQTNETLRAVTEGDLDERVDVQSCLEFSELSRHINSMILRLLADTDKMSLVLNRTNLHIGVYEYNTKMKHVRYTEHIAEIFGLGTHEMKRLASDRAHMQAFIERLRSEPVEGAENTYRLLGKREMFIKLEEVSHDNTVLGIVMDVTEEIAGRKRAETERDIDLMTGLYNRRGMERLFDEVFADPQAMGHGVLMMLDCDNLKDVNDTYGHAFGDMYLQHFAEILEELNAPARIVARTGGDEFVLLFYGYETEAAAQAATAQIQELQDHATVTLPSGKSIPLLFSYGFELTHGRNDHESLLSKADAHMYNSKRLRKKAWREQGAADNKES